MKGSIVLMIAALTCHAWSGNNGLPKEEAASLGRDLWEAHLADIRHKRSGEMKAKRITLDGRTMKWETVDFPGKGDRPKRGRSLFISLHGGGGTTPEKNDAQWKNQIRLARNYRPSEGIYLAPRAPGNTPDLWHQAHIDVFFDRIIQNMIALEGVDPDRVYLLGYSAGGDGVYQVAPRSADRWAAAAMMAGHPNETRPQGLRNLPFCLLMGGRDKAYQRNRHAVEWEKKLDALRKADPKGYEHWVVIYQDKGHWMDGEDRVAIPWMEKFTRQPLPDKIVWRQDDVLHDRFYWLAVPRENASAGQEIRATRAGQVITLDSTDVKQVTVLLNDEMLDLDQPVIVRAGRKILFSGRVPRRREVLERTLRERGDPRQIFSAEITVSLPTEK